MSRANASAPYDEAVLYAIRALWDGKANAGQQAKALDWLLYCAGGLSTDPFELGGVDGQRSTDFLLGRQFVARQVVALTKPAALEALNKRKTRASKAAVEKEAKE